MRNARLCKAGRSIKAAPPGAITPGQIGQLLLVGVVIWS
jgi:hypothetical protein